MRLLFVLAVAVALALPPAAVAADPPAPLPLQRGWELALDPGNIGLDRSWQGGRHGDRWKPTSVPSVFDPRPDEDTFRGSIGWYRLRFDGPARAAARRWALRFDQVRRNARVWLNGREIGANDDPYTPFEVPATGLRAGAPNTLVVRIDYRRPFGLREGWWNWGGITRPVALVARGPVVLHDAGLLPRRTCTRSGCRWRVLVDGWLENASDRVQQPSVEVALRAPDGTTSRAGANPRAMRPGERIRVRFAVPVQGDAQLWSPGAPRLYDAAIRTRAGGSVVQLDRERIGLRTVAVVDGMLRLNGSVLDLRGASVQEDIPGRGAALTDADIEQTVAELKALGVNVTRAHYLLDERLLDRLDEEGILVWSQAPVYHRDAKLRTPGQRSRELDVLRDTIIAARNHPSVIVHSVANELTAVPDERRMTQIWMRAAAALARDVDPTRPVAIDILSYPGIDRQATYSAFDVLGINSYYGWYEGKENRSTADIGDLAPYLRGMHARYPGKALVITEFGAEATEAGPADVKQTFAFQKRYLERNLAIVDRLGFMGGAIYWTAREFAVKPAWDGGAHPPVRDAIHNKGLISYDGERKPAFGAAADAFKATPLYRDDPVAVQRAELSEPWAFVRRSFLLLAGLALVGWLLWFDARCVRDIWRALRPPEAEVVELPARRVA